MQQVTIRSISLEGYRSYVTPTAFKFSTTGLHLIKGLNGEGKTSLFSALVWCLYKVNLNNTSNTKIPTWRWKRSKQWRGTRVQVVFGIGKYKYLIARHIDFKGITKGIDGNDNLLIFKKEKSDKTPFTATDVINDALYKSDGQLYLNQLLGIDSKTFLNSVLFGQRMARLMDSKDADKRDLFERLFDVDFIDTLKDKATLRQSATTADLANLTSEHTLLLRQQLLLAQQLENANTILAEFKEQRKLRLTQIKLEHTAANEDLEAVVQLLEVVKKKAAKSTKTDTLGILMQDADTKRERYYDAKEALSQINRDITQRNEDIATKDKYEASYKLQLKDVRDNCPLCNGKLDEKQVAKAKKIIQDQIIENRATKASLSDALANLQNTALVKERAYKATHLAYAEAMQAYDEAKMNYTATESMSELIQLQQREQLLEASIDTLTAQYKTEKLRTAPSVNIAVLQDELDSIAEQLPAIEKSIRIKNNYSKRLAWWLTKAFNAGGLKTYIFSASLNRLNQCIGAYTAYFDISIIFGIDLSKASKPFFCKVTLDGKNNVDYDELSGGEKQRVDLCIAFGLQDASEVKTSFNISILDEPEGNLDAEVLETLDMLLRIRSEKKAVYVVSHNSSMDLSSAIVYNISGGKNISSTIE